MSSLEIEVDVSESYINRVRPGQPVEAVLDAYPDWRIPAQVITTVPSADRQKATVRVRIGFERGEDQTLDRKPGGRSARPKTPQQELDSRILPDMGVKVSFLEERAAPTATDAPPRARFLVPKNAVRTQNGASVLFVVQGDRVERRAVKLGVEDKGQIEIVSGINAGERVVVEGPPTLEDGARVKER